MDNLAGVGLALAARWPADGRYDRELMRSALPSAPVDDRVSMPARVRAQLRRGALVVRRIIAAVTPTGRTAAPR